MGDLMQIHWLSEKGRICAQGIVPRWAAVTAGMCRIPLICLGWEKISVVQTSPRPAASTLQALRIGKYLEGHLIKPLHSALFTPSPTYKHILHSFYTFQNFLDFFLLETHSASFDALAWLLHKLLACFPISIHISPIPELTHLAAWLYSLVPSPEAPALAEFVCKATFLVYKYDCSPDATKGSRKTFGSNRWMRKLTQSWHPVFHFTHFSHTGSCPTNISTAAKETAEDISLSSMAFTKVCLVTGFV